MHPTTLWLNIPWQGKVSWKPSVWQMRLQLPRGKVCCNRKSQVHSITHTVHNSPNFSTLQGNGLKPHRSAVHTFPQLDLAILKTHISFSMDAENHLPRCCTKPSAYQQDILQTRVAYRTSDSSQKFIPNILSKLVMFFIEWTADQIHSGPRETPMQFCPGANKTFV